MNTYIFVGFFKQFFHSGVNFSTWITKEIGKDGNSQLGIGISEKDLGIGWADFVKRLLRKQRSKRFFVGFDTVDLLTELTDLITFAQFGKKKIEGEDRDGVEANSNDELRVESEKRSQCNRMLD